LKERALIATLLAPLATSGSARGLRDDAAVLAPPLGRELVLTHDILASGIHYLPSDPASDVAWKLLAVNLSDLAAMGARPLGVMLGLGLSAAEDEAWVTAFTAGLGRGLEHWGVALYGGDTVSGLAQAVLGLTAIGQVEPGRALSRASARPGDVLYVSGTIGDAGLGLGIASGRIAKGEAAPDKFLINRFRRPYPRLALGQALAGLATAAMDVSDGLLIDAERLASASGVAVTIELARLPLSAAALARTAPGDAGQLERAAAGDDYELLFTLPAGVAPPVGVQVTVVGHVSAGAGLTVIGNSGEVVQPERLGWEHGS